MEYRPFYLAREWVKQGHEVTIVASSQSHVRTRNPDLESAWAVEKIEGVRYIWLKTPRYSGNGVRRALNIFAFLGRMFLHRSLIDQFGPWDAVIASSTYPLDMVPAKRLAARSKATLIYEVHDLWPLSLIELGGMSARHPFVIQMQWGEKFAYKHAEIVVSLLPKAKDHMLAHGMVPEKFQYIPNGIVVDEWKKNGDPLPEMHSNLIKRLRQEGRFLIAYTGSHGIANELDCLLEAASLLENSTAAFILVGQGPEKASLQRIALERKLKNVHFLPPVDRSSIPELLNQMDALYIGLKNEPIFRFGISPNKLMDYMMAARPIIFAVNAGNDPVQESGCGLSVTAGDPIQISNAVQDLLKMPGNLREEMGRNGQSYVVQHHDYSTLAARFIELIRPDNR